MDGNASTPQIKKRQGSASLGGLHEDLRRGEAIAPPSERSFGITFAVVFALLAFWLWWRKDLPSWAIGSLIVSVGFLTLAFSAPQTLKPLNLLWLKVGLLLHRIVNPIIMGLLFFFVFTPMGAIMRMRGKDFLRLKFRTNDASYWVPRSEADAQASSMRNQF